MVPHVSVIICAYTEKRWEDLVAAVESLQQQTETPFEIIVVVDHNPQLFERVRSRFPGINAIVNTSSRGLSAARNSGIAVARGSKIAFLDDDAAAQTDWLARLSAWCDEPHVMGAGGKVNPVWQGVRPRWFPDEFAWVVGCSYTGMPEKASPIRNLLGSSMCFRREVFDAVGGFREGIGRVGTIPLGCEETELCIRTRQHWPEGIFIYEPAATSGHTVPDHRVRWRYFFSRCYAEGVSKALVARFVGANDALSSERTYTFQTLPRGVIRGIADVFLRRDLYGFARAAAIVAGLATTAAGYFAGSVSLRLSGEPAAMRTEMGKAS